MAASEVQRPPVSLRSPTPIRSLPTFEDTLAYDDMSLRIHSMNLEQGFCEIQSNSRYLHDERSFAVEVMTSPLWHMPTPRGRESSITSEPGVVSAISIDDLGLLQRAPANATDGCNCVDQRQQLCGVMAIGTGQDHREWHSVCVGSDMVLGARSRIASRVAGLAGGGERSDPRRIVG